MQLWSNCSSNPSTECVLFPERGETTSRILADLGTVLHCQQRMEERLAYLNPSDARLQVEIESMNASHRIIEKTLKSLVDTQHKLVGAVSNLQQAVIGEREDKHGLYQATSGMLLVRRQIGSNRGTRTSDRMQMMLDPVGTEHLADVPEPWTARKKTLKLPTASSQVKLALDVDDPMVHTQSVEPCELASDVVMPETLSHDWPSDLEIRPGYYSAATASVSHAPEDTMEALSRIELPHMRRTASLIRRKAVEDTSYNCLLDPHSWYRLVFDGVGLCLVIFDLLMTPYMLAWNVPFSGLFELFEWGAASFWTIDIPVNFITRNPKDGERDFSYVSAARRYICRWFIVDVTLVLIQWLNVFVDSGDARSYGAFIQVHRAFRLLRLVSAVRVFRLVRTCQTLMYRYIVVKDVLIAVNILVVFAVYFWVNHVIGCGWYAIGRMAPSDSGGGWLQTSFSLEGEDILYEDMGGVFLYLTSYHWSVAQTTLGGMELVASSSMERVVSIAMLVAGMLISSTIVSVLSAWMVGITFRDQARRAEIWKLVRFLRESGVDSAVALRVRRQIELRMKKRRRLTESDVPVIELLSSSLSGELRFQMYGAYIMSLPLFRLWVNLSSSVGKELCTNAASKQVVPSNHDLFVAGALGFEAYFLISGLIRYTQDPESSVVKQVKPFLVRPNTWMCEMALWTKWVHVGTAVTLAESEILVINADAILNAVPKHRLIHEVTLEYSQLYHHRVITARPPLHTWPTDLSVPEAEFPDIVASMPLSMKATIGIEALQRIAPSWSNWSHPVGRSKLTRLKEQVVQGFCTVVLNGQGEPQRLVSVTVLRLERTDDRFLVQVGELEGQHVKACCKLPGLKQASGEYPVRALDRLLSNKLEPFEGRVQVLASETEEDHQESFGIPTKYCKTVFLAALTDESELRLAGVRSRIGRDTAIGKKSWALAERSWGLGDFNAKKNDHPSPIGRDISPQDVFAVSTEDTSYYYTWLTQAEMEVLRLAEHQKYISSVISSLEVVSRTASVFSRATSVWGRAKASITGTDDDDVLWGHFADARSSQGPLVDIDEDD